MSAKKEKVAFVRTDEFEAVEDELGQAMDLLDGANARIAALLTTEVPGELLLESAPAEGGEAPATQAPPVVEASAVKAGTPRVRGRAKAAAAAAAPEGDG